MFQAGKFYKTKEGKVLEILMIRGHRQFPIIAIDKKGVLSNYTLEGQFQKNKPSDKDITSEQVRSFQEE